MQVRRLLVIRRKMFKLKLVSQFLIKLYFRYTYNDGIFGEKGFDFFFLSSNDSDWFAWPVDDSGYGYLGEEISQG